METTDIILAIIALISAIITGVVIPLVKSKLNNDQLAVVDYWMNLLIAAAETEFKGEKLGESKKRWVIEQMKAMGLKFDEAAVSSAIDGLCRELTSTGVINSQENGE